MAKRTQKFYVVWEGVNPGVYTTWESCQLQIKGYPNAKFKSFKSREEAERAFEAPFSQTKKRQAAKKAYDRTGINQKALSVDAACSGNPGKMEYRGVWVGDNIEWFHFGPAPYGTNNIGEFLALVHALALLKRENMHDIPIYSDSKIAINWLKKGKINTKLPRNNQTKVLFDLISRAEKWISENTYSNPILKWETKIWGEIPADFGRK